MSRLKTVSGGWSRSYDYDPFGNGWLSGAAGLDLPPGYTPRANVYNGQNRILVDTQSYDAAGNQTTVNGNALAYDAENRIKSLATVTGSETVLYDGLGQRVEKLTSGAASRRVTENQIYSFGYR